MIRNTHQNAEKDVAEKRVTTPAGRGLATRIGAVATALALALSFAACSATKSDTTSSGTSSETTQEQQATVSATVEIDATAADGESTTYDVEVEEGSTVYDALVATGVDVNASDSDYGMYVMGIDGLASGDYGDMSGWMFEVNGEMAEVSCSELEVSDGDQIVWIYVTEYTE